MRQSGNRNETIRYSVVIRVEGLKVHGYWLISCGRQREGTGGELLLRKKRKAIGIVLGSKQMFAFEAFHIAF